jgi:hypothetical protein
MSIIENNIIVTAKPVIAPKNPIVHEKNFLPTKVTRTPNIIKSGDKIYGLLNKNSVNASAENTGQAFLCFTITFGEHLFVVVSTDKIYTGSSVLPSLSHYKSTVNEYLTSELSLQDSPPS